MGNLINWLGENWQLLMGTAGTVVLGASLMVKALAPLTKNKKDDKLAALLDKAVPFLNKLALNPPLKK